MKENAEKDCPLVGSTGCTVYSDRPTACRLYPLARASSWDQEKGKQEEFFFFMETPGCLGIREERVRTLEDWLRDQGLSPYLESNLRMLRLLFHPGRDRTKSLDDSQLQKVIVACYSLDVFRDFLFGTKMLDSLDVDEKTRAAIEHDDEMLLDFGYTYLEKTLFP